jgi:hypothetical protein
MDQSPSGEADSHPARQEVPLIFLEPEGSLPCSKEPATGPYPEPEIYSSQLTN